VGWGLQKKVGHTKKTTTQHFPFFPPPNKFTSTHTHTNFFSQKKKDMSFDQEKQYSSKTDDIEGYVFPIWVSRKNISSASSNLNGFETDTEYASSQGLRCNPAITLKMLSTIQHMIYNPHLGDSSITQSGGYYSHSFEDPATGSTRPCIEEYIEYVKTPPHEGDELLGWRFWIHILSKNYSFEKALESHWAFLKKNPPKKSSGAPKKNIPEISTPHHIFNEPCATKLEWINRTLSPYMDEALGEGTEDGNLALHLPLSDARNPANILKNLTLEWSNTLIREQYGDKVDPCYLDEKNYFTHLAGGAAAAAAAAAQDDDDNTDDMEELVHSNVNKIKLPVAPVAAAVAGGMNNNVIRFPRGAHPISWSSQKPSILFRVNIFEPPLDLSKLSQPQQCKFKREAVQALEGSNQAPIVGDVMRRAQAKIEQLLKTHTPDELSKSPMLWDIFRSVCLTDDLNPGSIFAFQWLENNLKVHGAQWSLSQEPTPLVDSSLSLFGNRMAADLLRIEYICGT